MSTILEGLYYAESHEYVKVEGEYGYVGITDYAQHELGNVVYVDMPEVEDEVTAKSEDFIKRFHLHMMDEPKIDGNEITITYKGGKLRCTVLEPQNASITAIGGGDMRFTTVGIPVPSDKTENRECGWGKVIIEPTDKAKTHKFKVVMEILDNEI